MCKIVHNSSQALEYDFYKPKLNKFHTLMLMAFFFMTKSFEINWKP
jgi:hypothetical protein